MVEDFFALLGEPRRPWLDPARVKDTFHRLSRTGHPDQQTPPLPGEESADAGFARLNQAQVTLRDSRARLRHLLELEYPQVKLSGPAEVPATLADLFAPIHRLIREIDDLLAKKAAAPSALAKALLARDEFSLRERAETQLGDLEILHAAVVEQLQAFDAAWSPRPPDAAVQLHAFYQRFAYAFALDRPTPRTPVPTGDVTRSIGRALRLPRVGASSAIAPAEELFVKAATEFSAASKWASRAGTRRPQRGADRSRAAPNHGNRRLRAAFVSGRSAR